MRIAELGRRSGVPVPTIKYYLREGLLPAGELTSPNQARYTEDHLRRLRLVRAMVELGGLSIAAVRDVLGALDDPEKSLHKAMGTISAAMAPPDLDASDEAAREVARAFVERQGWTPRPDSYAFKALVAVLTTARDVGHERFTGVLDAYARACVPLAEADLDYALGADSEDEALENVVVGTVLGDAAMAAIRAIARRETSERRKDTGSPPNPEPDC
ncbi:MerR family transcriptional regulator [Saccharothrix syringae]|uniref:MerR family transcriptional regulator n=1 Tax=Saccharothrix syringae TaxID=103733 RepID=A0A5Q0GUI2_SACSY|nr:MerR family transcriptional regulator [Saccharothrix syringae]QFZ17609.1 MerR family transcriptional regulator [Saccharothrix syringae]